MHVSRLTEPRGAAPSATGRHTARPTALDRIDRTPGPADRCSRLLRPTAEGRARHAVRCRRRASRLSGTSERPCT
ncbi:hypothetical protein ABZ023_06930 [Streptomyces sp. NPDC006367]|uniref:hypothetical protein n=1 Tax=unclassified Streptomyces TaxID=2593676 RepID=UPI0033B2DE62